MVMGSSSQPDRLLPLSDKVYRVVQWATGRIGAAALRGLIRSSQFDVVGVYVHSAGKDGKDAGEICGLGPIGVLATSDPAKIIALEPDCIVAVPEGANVDDMCRFLAAGINIVTSRVDYLDPYSMDQQVRARIETACALGGATIHASGCSPGFSSEALPLVLTSMSRSMDCLTIDEYADIPASCPDVQVTDVMGFGRKPGREFDAGLLDHIGHGFRQSLNVLARALGIEIDKTVVEGETANARQRFLLPGGTPIEAGTVAAQRITVTAMRGTEPVLRFRLNWHCTLDLDTNWEMRRTGWKIRIDGETPLDAEISFPISPERWSPAMAELTANRVINAVPFVCEAPAGIATTIDLLTIIPDMGRVGRR
jgi:2,4-diaminopentanoate dehydrogenase